MNQPLSSRQKLVIAIGWTIAILVGCSIPGTDIPTVDFDLFEEDKLIHFSLFLVFGWIWMSALTHPLKKRTVLVCISGLFYACATEIYQGLLPWERTPDPMDALANTIGLLTGIGLYRWHWLRTRQSKTG